MPTTLQRHDQAVDDAVRTEFHHLAPHEILHASTRALLGVTEQAVDALLKLEINTVFDLATSRAFTDATQILHAGLDSTSGIARQGVAPADVVREDRTAGTSVDQLQFLPIDALEAVPEADAAAIASALDAADIRDLALYRPFRTAAELLVALYFPDNADDADPERPADLLPRTGEYPTERVQYSTLLMDAIRRPDQADLVAITGERFGPIDLAALAGGDAGFQTVAFGALLTFSQSWFAQGVTLGQLLHSTSLAPGESTRIAVIDWSRRSRAGETESISETDDLTNDTAQNRAVSEVTQAVANEAQGGFSHAATNSTTSQEGTSAAGEISAPLGGLLGGPSGSMGHTSSSSTTDATADSYSSSWGRRNVSSSMMQNVNDRTHQHAHSSRSRRASVIKEVAQSEQENVSTRVIANYNHMHALTVQYYEVVQVYRVEVALARADRVVFIPVKLLDFASDAMIRRFRGALSRAALTYEIREALDNLDVIEIRPDRSTRFAALDTGITQWLNSSVAAVIRPSLVAAATAAATPADVAHNDAPAADGTPAAAPAPPAVRVRMRTAIPIVQRVNDRLWSAEQSSRLSGLLNRSVLRPDSASVYLPTDVTIDAISVDAAGAPITAVFGLRGGGSDQSVSPTDPLPLIDVTRISLTGSSPERDAAVTVTLTANRSGVRFPIVLPAVTVPKGTTGTTPLVTVEPGGINQNLTRHLADNRLHYSQAVLRSLDAAQIALMLAGLGVEVSGETVPVAQVIDPMPIRYVGNYLAFTMSSDAERDPEWKSWLDDHDVRVGDTRVDLVPLGTGGTFAEAVLGRSNSAEKLDLTRFWDWQDSPIPLQPTEIAAISTGSRAMAEDVTPGQLSNPIINITSPASMPDPVGTAAILQAVQNGSMFRDMSGLSATVGLAQAGLQATAAGASTAGQQAGDNMNNLLKANTERQRIAAEMITSLAKTAASAYTGGLTPPGGDMKGGGGSSQQGAKINYFDKTATPAGSTTGDSGTVPAGGVSSSAGSSSAGGSGATTSARPLTAYSQNPAALGSVWGDTQSPSDMIDRIIDKVGLSDADPAVPAGGALTTRKAWPHLGPTQVTARIHDLVANPNLFNQGGLGLCTAAAFFHHVLQRKGSEFDTFATALYGSGVGYLGALKVAPGGDLRNVDYAALLTRFPTLPPQADWMTMSALRDSANWFFDFEGAPDESFSMSTSAKELSTWYRDTGYYTSVGYSDTTGLAAVKNVKKTDSNQVALWVEASLVAPGSKSTHMITLETPFVIDEAADTISFDYWTWAQPVKTMAVKLSTFTAAYLGAITAGF